MSVTIGAEELLCFVFPLQKLNNQFREWKLQR